MPTDYVRNALKPFGVTQHLMGNQIVDIRNDRAQVRTGVQATHCLAGDRDTILTLWAASVDVRARTERGANWTITRRELQPRGSQRTKNAA